MLLFHRCGYLSAGSVCGYNSARSLKKAVTCGVEAPGEHARARGADSNQRACVEEVELVHRNEAGSERGQSDEDLEEQDEDARREAGHHHNDSYAESAARRPGSVPTSGYHGRGLGFVEKTPGVGSPPRPRMGDSRRENRDACRE